ncbi:SET domain-containing protein [Polyplosphaeria fusca]|uniref:SET domain-containing protein n=1 Tax=Polyplosphaeria fusca TaxID=682080 RepID=A0A9P4R3Z7_9PLEO|nr:SET domain-containing protein [Polyplosphaeria fusca]
MSNSTPKALDPHSKPHISLQRCPDLVLISDTPKGRGVFATSRIPKKAVLDVCPVLVLGLEENARHIEKTTLYHYTYNWPVTDQHNFKHVAQALIFGLGSMFNHSLQDQNVVWERDTEKLVITYRAARDIEPGEELCISYGNHLTFEDTDALPDEVEEEDGTDHLSHIQID